MSHKLHTTVCGRYKLRAVRLSDDGHELSGRDLTGWFNNLITNAGLNRMATFSDYIDRCQVGSGSTTPAFTDTALVSLVAASTTIFDSDFGAESTPPYYCWRRNTYRFAAGVATGNISEVGVGWASSGGLFSRALILDGVGDPTTITVLADETLDVVYELRFSIPSTDFVSDSSGITFTGSIGGTYDYIIRAANADTSGNANPNPGWFIGVEGVGMSNVPSSAVDVYSGDIGSVDGEPSSPSGANPVFSANAYTADSYQLTYTMAFSIAQGNASGGLRSLKFKAGFGDYQCQFDPAIPKTDEDILSLTFVQSWGRA